MGEEDGVQELSTSCRASGAGGGQKPSRKRWGLSCAAQAGPRESRREAEEERLARRARGTPGCWAGKDQVTPGWCELTFGHPESFSFCSGVKEQEEHV